MASVEFAQNLTAPKAGILNSILSFFVRVGENSSYLREVEFLQSLSDAQLEKRGLKREDIVHHVVRGVYVG